jgi:hypothetical protein
MGFSQCVQLFITAWQPLAVTLNFAFYAVLLRSSKKSALRVAKKICFRLRTVLNNQRSN